MSVGIVATGLTAAAGAYGAYKSSQGGGAAGAPAAGGGPGVNPASTIFGQLNYRSSGIKNAAQTATSEGSLTMADNGSTINAAAKETKIYLWVAVIGLIGLAIVLLTRRKNKN